MRKSVLSFDYTNILHGENFWFVILIIIVTIPLIITTTVNTFLQLRDSLVDVLDNVNTLWANDLPLFEI